MDGNGRWAQSRGKPRTTGHREGLKAAKRVTKAASEMGISCLSLYTFSTENWSRAKEEVRFLMVLIRTHLRKELAFYHDNNIRVVHSGDTPGLPADVREAVEFVTDQTAVHNGLTLNLAINYGGRDEIVRAVNRWLSVRTNGSREHALTIADLESHLDHPGLPNPDLIIRTGGDLRLSNFLLWEGAYSELLFSPHRWPDWGERDLVEAVCEYQRRTRTFGSAR